MSVLIPELGEVAARVGISTLIGLLNRHGPCSMYRYALHPLAQGQG